MKSKDRFHNDMKIKIEFDEEYWLAREGFTGVYATGKTPKKALKYLMKELKYYYKELCMESNLHYSLKFHKRILGNFFK